MLTIKTRITPKTHKNRVKFILPDIFSLQSISEKTHRIEIPKPERKK